MNVTTLFKHINSAYRSTDDDPPTTGTDFNEWLLVANRKIDEWARDVKATWRSLFETRSVGVVVSGTQDYPLDAELVGASDKVTVIATDGTKHYFTICKPQERDRFTKAAYIAGTPSTLTFTDDITADSPIVGGTIYLSGYYIPDELVDGDSLIKCDDPLWVAYAAASELAGNDLTYEDKEDTLNTKANNRYSMMASNNRRGTSDNPRTANYNTDQLPRHETGRVVRNF